jgi:rhodanese-related sulfurtransferase
MMIKTINAHELKQKIDNTPSLCLIDVRELPEWQALRIPGAVHIPKDQITLEISAIVLDKNHPIYLHCKSGVRSLYAATRLVEMGYKNVYSVDGGIMDWSMFGYPTEQSVV